MVTEIGMPVRKATEIIGGVEARGISEGLEEARRPKGRWFRGRAPRRIQERASQLEAERKAREKKQLETKHKKQLEAEKLKAYGELKQQYESQLRQVKGIQERQKLKQAYQQQLGQTIYLYKQQRKKVGTAEFRAELVTPQIAEVKARGVPVFKEEEVRKLTPEMREAVLVAPTREVAVAKEVPIKPSLKRGEEIKPSPKAVTLPPTELERFKKEVKEAGPITGTISYASGFASRKYYEKELKRIKEKPGYRAYQIKPTQTLIKFGVGVTPYVTPAGPYVLMAGGTETLIFPRGKQKTIELQKGLEEGQFFGVKVKEKPAKVLSYVPPIAQISLGYVVSPLFKKTKGFIKTIGREKLPVERVVPRDVLTGKKMFPEAPSSQHYQLFQKSPYKLPSTTKPGMYHATGQQFWTKTAVTTPGTSEFPGLYGSYGVSPHFLRIKPTGGSVLEYFTGDVSLGGKPGVMYIQPQKFVVGKTAPKGSAFIPKIKTEVEAIIPPETALTKIGKRYYFKYQGQRVPIDEFKTVVGITEKPVTTFKEIAPSYEGVSYTQRTITRDVITTLPSLTKTKEVSYVTTTSPSTQITPPRTLSLETYQVYDQAKPTAPIMPSKAPKSPIKPTTTYKPIKTERPTPKITQPTTIYPKSPTKRREEYVSPPIVPPRTPYKKPVVIPKGVPKIQKIKPRLKKIAMGYKAWIKRGGEWKALKGVYPKGEAIRVGEREARETLAARFKVTPTKIAIKKVLDEYLPPKKIFRPYKIKKGVKIPLKSEWIQRRGYRLGTKAEVKEIQLFKKKKEKKMKWF